MTPRYIDVHCHPQFSDYDSDRDAMIEAMQREGVVGIVVGCDLASSTAALALASQHEHLYAAVGLHPNQTEEAFDLEAYRALAEHPKVVAVGECGLDYFRSGDTKDAQVALFRAELALARELDKPVIIHCRPTKGSVDAYRDLITLLHEEKQQRPSLRGDIHFFVGGVAEAEELVALGFTVSFTAVITFARDYDEVIKAIPLSAVLAETDAPYVAPVSRRGERNDPLSVVDVTRKIAEIRGEDPELVRETLRTNAQQVFNLT